MLNIPHTFVSITTMNGADFERATQTDPEPGNPLDEAVECLDARLEAFYVYGGNEVRQTVEGIVPTDLDALRVLLAAASVGLDGADGAEEGSIGYTSFQLDRAHRLLRNLTDALGVTA